MLHSELLEKLFAGEARAIARAITKVENGADDAADIMKAVFPKTGNAVVIGITGSPGAGKSSLVDKLALFYKDRGEKIGIVCVDPSSPFSGGAILGDRIRMQTLGLDKNVFIRSMATRGSLGGLARTTADLVTLLDASGRDVVLIETVGVGQSELDIARTAKVVAVVLMPGAGDEVQALKAGILEIADLFVINKADHPGAAQLERELHSYVDRPIFQAVASEGTGISELAAALLMLPVRPPRALPGLTVIDHLGLAVTTLDAALGFWEKQIGLRVTHRETVAHERVHVAMLPVGEARVELLEATEPDSTIAKFIAKRGAGLHHVALRVPDFEATVERLRASGARLLNEPRQGAGGHTYVFIHPASTGGVLLELIKDEHSK